MLALLCENGFNGAWLCGEKITHKLCKFLNKKHLIALKEGEAPLVCTWETSVSISNLCGTAVIDLVKSCHWRSCVVKWVATGD